MHFNNCFLPPLCICKWSIKTYLPTSYSSQTRLNSQSYIQDFYSTQNRQVVGTRWGGGILVVHRDTLRVRRIPLVTTPTTFEALAVAVSSSRGPLTVLAIYRPGSALPSAAFFSEFALFLEQFALYNTQLV